MSTNKTTRQMFKDEIRLIDLVIFFRCNSKRIMRVSSILFVILILVSLTLKSGFYGKSLTENEFLDRSSNSSRVGYKLTKPTNENSSIGSRDFYSVLFSKFFRIESIFEISLDTSFCLYCFSSSISFFLISGDGS